jgi:hypothetical protein
VLTLALRRSLAQRRLLAGVVALVTLGTTVLGVGTLLLSATQDRAFTAEVRKAPSQDIDVTAFLVSLKGSDEVRVRGDARAVVGDALAPLHPKLTSNAVSRMRRLGEGRQLGYLASTDSLRQRAALTSGRWTKAAGEAVVPAVAADRLHLALGDRVTIGKEVGTNPVDNTVTVVVVGTFRATSRSGWDSDPLTGTGYVANYSDESSPVPAPAFGPFEVDEPTFLASGSTVDALQVTGHPTMTHATDTSMAEAAYALQSSDRLLTARVADRVQISRIASDLPDTLTRVRAQRAATRSTVLVVLLLSTTLALIALLLAGRLLGGVRETERALLTSLGLGRGQLAVATLAETLLVAAVATVVAVPAAALAHSAVTHLPAMESAGLSQGPTMTAGLVSTEAAGAVLLALALAVPMLSPALPGRRAAVARSGVDLLLVLAAAVAWWQLHSQPSTVTSGDVTRTLAPVIGIAAATAVAVRLAPLLLGLVASVAARLTALVLPLATSQAARRPHAGAALVLLAMAAASATFGLALNATWERSQGDQAALRVGTDVSLALSGPASDRQAESIAAATAGSMPSAVTDRSLALGRYVGEVGSAPLIVAVDSRRAGSLLRGRLDQGRTWSGVGNLLTPKSSVGGLPLSDAMSIVGTAPAGVGVTVTPTLVVQGASGLRSTISADPIPLDGQSHRLRGVNGVEGARLVAARLTLNGDPGIAPGGSATVSIALSVTHSDAGSRSASNPGWHIRAPDPNNNPVQGSAVEVDPSAGGTTLRTTAQVDLGALTYSEGDLLATAFAVPAALPVAVSQRLADEVGTKVGGQFSGTVSGVELPLKVVAVVPTVPSAPARVAVLADTDTLSRMVIGAGDLEPVVDAWWVADPTPKTAHALSRLKLGDVTTRAAVASELRRGPLRASVPAALTLLVVAAGLLLFAGTALVIGADRPARSAEVARLRALGLTRGGAKRLVFTEHGLVLGLLIVTGAFVGAVASLAFGPSLIRSDVGIAPVPAAVLAWPWVGEVAAVVGLLVGCLVIAAVITLVAVRRSGPAQLRAEDS